MNPKTPLPSFLSAETGRDFETRLADALRALPEQAAPADAWARLYAALPAQAGPAPATPAAAHRRRQRWQWPLALAASVLLGFGVLLGPNPASRQAPAPAAVSTDEIEQLMARSASLESDLDRLRPQAVIWDAVYARTTRTLEQQLAVVDVQLGATDTPDATVPLWRDRVQLMTALVQTHQRAAGRMPTSSEAQNSPQEWNL